MWDFSAVAQKEEEELQRYKEANRPPPLQLNPERLGNHLTETFCAATGLSVLTVIVADIC